MATKPEIADIVTMVKLWWPHSTVGMDAASLIEAWHAALADYDRGEIEVAVRHELRTGREHAPAVGVIAHRIELGRQGPAPSGEDAQRWLARHARLLPYRPVGQSAEDTVEALEQLAAAGAHEAVLRFVASHGCYAIRNMPDPERFSLDANQVANRRDMLRDYQQRVVPDWEADPTPGMALMRACRSVGIDPAERRQVQASAWPVLTRRDRPRQLPAPEVEADDDGELVDPKDVLDMFRRTAVANRMARRQAGEAAARLAEEERAELAAAERELAEHARRRDRP
jgi:hypothetical protein